QGGSVEACSDLIRSRHEHGDDDGAARWAIEACRLGGHSGCEYLAERDAELPPMSNIAQRRLYRRVCEAGRAPACDRLARREAPATAIVQAVLDAVAKQDTAAFAKLVPGSIYVTGLWFADPACAREFSADRLVSTERQPALLRCLATLDAHLEPSSS